MAMHKEELRELLIEDINWLGQMDVPEYILYCKWAEVNEKFSSKSQSVSSLLFEDSVVPSEVRKVKENIWTPSHYNDYLQINPKVISVDTKEKRQVWDILRVFCVRLPWSKNVGRLKRFYVIDENTGKYLGVISLGSDFINAGGREKYIGWTKKEKMDHMMLNWTAMGSTIAPTQPFGYNYLGGKLMALLTCSNEIENVWNSNYKESLAGITTTSLYGGFSQYNNLKYWRKCKSSNGKINREPSTYVYKEMNKWLLENYPEEHPSNEEKLISHPKIRIISNVTKKLDVKLFNSNSPRGVYFCPLYENTCSFLSMKDKELGAKKFDNSVETLVQIWKDRYASKRINKLVEENRIKEDILFYDEMLFSTWEESKVKYL